MNDEENLNKSLIDELAVPISKKSCCFYLFCCCLCSSDKKSGSRQYYITKWRKYLSKETESKSKLNDPFRILTNLWAHKNVIRDLEQIRLNPNLLGTKSIRNDLEFYIPQLCTFMLFGEYEIVEELLAFLCKACFASFSFAHRIVWFLKSMMNPENLINEKIRTILHLIQTIFKSEKKSAPLERLHVAGSKKFLEFQNQTEDPSISQLNQETKRKIVRDKINEYIDLSYSSLIQERSQSEKLLTKTQANLKLSFEEMYLETFNRYECITNDEDNMSTQYVKQIDMNDINLSSFLSNINFVDHLCNICEILRYTSVENQEKTLLNEVRKINKILPSNVYMPFINDSIRNYVIASIPLSEVKIFRTKNRAPYMITFECFRLDELNYNYHIKSKAATSHNKQHCDNNSPDENSSEEDNLKSDSLKEGKKISETGKDPKQFNNTAYNDFNMQKLNTFSVSLLNDLNKEKKDANLSLDSNIFKKENRESLNIEKSGFYTAIRDKKTKSRTMLQIIRKSKSKKSQLKEREKNKIIFPNYLLESDVNISKPLIIKNILYNQNQQAKDMGKSKKKKKNFIKLEEIDYETDPEDYKRVEDVINKNVKSEVRKLSFEKEIKNRKSSYDEECRIEKLEIDNKNNKKIETEILDDTVNLAKNNSNKNEEITILSLDDSKYITKPKLSNDIKTSDSNDLNIANEIIRHEENFIPQENPNIEVFEVFGEKIEKQTERLKKNSPFGFLNTYKLFKVIVKSGEDLRQEQFATQLINEFSQIFKIEKVDCWVNTYEILATGNNVGIIEVVPNSISLDSLKRRSTLKEFYDLYFVKDSDNYKTAMKNFISSLAGYSLVCYFLQIKDRHNANILIDDQGHLIHIDFGFMLSNAPGKGLQFEKAPFKLTKEFVDVMGGVDSKNFSTFRKLLWKGFIAIVKHCEKILILVEMMYCGHGNKLACFEKGHQTVEDLRLRFVPKSGMSKTDYMRHVDSLIEQSIDNWRTKWYDKYQYWVQGIFY